MNRFLSSVWFVVVVSFSVLFCNTARAQSSDAVPELPKVEVVSNVTDNQLRRDFVAGKIIIGRKRVEDSGAQNVAELLKREPAVSVTADGRIGLMGLPGYTQILVNGAPPPPGKGVMEMELMQVERIEIVKSSVAEFGPFGIAGTINVVTRKLGQSKLTRMNLAAIGGAANSGRELTWATNQVDDKSPFGFNAQVSLRQSSKTDEARTRETTVSGAGALTETVQGKLTKVTEVTSLSATGNLVWRITPEHTLQFEPDIANFSVRVSGQERSVWAQTDAGPASSTFGTSAPLPTLSLPLKWTAEWKEHGRLLVSWRPTRLWNESESQRQDQYIQQAAIDRRALLSAVSDIETLRIDYSVKVAEAHDIKVGASRLLVKEKGSYAYWLNGRPDLSLQALGDGREAVDRKLQVFVQDDWRIDEQWAVNLGLSGEHRETKLREGDFAGQGGHNIWAPSAHLAWKLDVEGERQLRIGVARTFRAPDLDDLSTRPTINPIFPCNAAGVCFGNTLVHADTAGNPALKPERALGINVSYEHALGDDSLFSIEAYARQLDDVIGQDLLLESVPWSPVKRYVARPSNLGSAWIRGLDLETRLQVRDFWKKGPKLNITAGLNLARSQLSTVPGPDNQMPDQTPWAATLGGNYKLQEWPVELSADARWTPSVWTRTSAAQRIYQDRQFTMSWQAAWTVDANTRVRLVVDQWTLRGFQKLEEFGAPVEMIRATDLRKHARVALRMELKY